MTQKQARMLVRKLTNLMAAEVCFSNDPGRETADYVNRHENRVVKELLEIFPETPKDEPQAQDSVAQTGCIPKGSYEVNRGALHLRASEFMDRAQSEYGLMFSERKVKMFRDILALLEKTAREAFSEGYKARLTDGAI